MTDLKFQNEHLATFNGHANNAANRAMNICRARFAPGNGGIIALEAAHRDGIMAIFNTDPTPASALFAAACFIFANGLDRVEA